MTSPSTPEEILPPDEAFAVLADETRLEILRVLGESNDPMPFTAVRNAVGLRQGGQFNYHLDKVVGHFVTKTDDGYELRQPGRRLVEAVLSGAVTHHPVLEPTDVDFECLLCGSPVQVSYRANASNRTAPSVRASTVSTLKNANHRSTGQVAASVGTRFHRQVWRAGPLTMWSGR